MPLTSFGQRVRLRAYDGAANIVFDSQGINTIDDGLEHGLRVDFEIRFIEKFDVATFKIYNITSDTSKMLASGLKFVTLSVSLHGEDYITLVENFYISNVITVKQVPNSITTLYCAHNINRIFYEQQLKNVVQEDTLRKQIKAAQVQAGVSLLEPDYKFIPLAVLDTKLPNPNRLSSCSVYKFLSDIGAESRFNYYTKPEGIVCVGKPTLKNIDETELPDTEGLTLNTNDMRANPRIGVSSLEIVSNLDVRIQTGVVLDIDNLVTADSSLPASALSVIRHILDSVSGYNKYVVHRVSHKGSNYSDSWETTAYAIAPSRGLERNPTRTGYLV